MRPLSARGIATVRSCMTPLSARSSSPREGAGSPRIKVAAARLISEGGGDPGGLPAVSTLPAAESTVHTHVLHIYEKTSVRTRAGIALFAMENDLIHA